MSKFSKLVRNPKKFLLDSRLRRIALLGASQVNFRQALAPLPIESSSEVWGTRLQEYFARQVSLLFVPEREGRTSVRLGVRRKDQQHLTAAIAQLAKNPELRISIKGAKGANFVAHSLRLFALDSFLTTQKYFSLNLRRAGNGQLFKAKLSFEFWEDNGEHWSAPRRNPVARRVSNHTVEAEGLFQPGRPRDVRELTKFPLPTQHVLEIDVVYTWVDHRDPHWCNLYAAAVGDARAAQHDDARSLDRFLSRDELKYSLRSVAMYAPWVRLIHIVSNCPAPSWLDLSHPRIRWVDHSQVFSDDLLPTFSSHAIEARLQHVPDLAEHFLYFNDDFFLTRNAAPSDFYFPNGISKSFTEEYGVVNGEKHDQDPDYMNAARNGQRLIEERFGRTPTALHKHTPYALRRSVLLEMEQAFSEAYQCTVRSKFRSLTDVSTVSFLYHHFAYLTGRSLYASRDAALLNPGQTRYLDRMLRIVDGLDRPLSVCLNDGQGSAQDEFWDRHARGFLEALFNSPCEFEKASTASEQAAEARPADALAAKDAPLPETEHVAGARTGSGEPARNAPMEPNVV